MTTRAKENAKTHAVRETLKSLPNLERVLKLGESGLLNTDGNHFSTIKNARCPSPIIAGSLVEDTFFLQKHWDWREALETYGKDFDPDPVYLRDLSIKKPKSGHYIKYSACIRDMNVDDVLDIVETILAERKMNENGN